MQRNETYSTLCARARDLIPILAERAERTEELRQLPPETVLDLHDAGLFRMLQPAALGGAELDFGALVDVGAILARGCASTAWNLTNLASHHWMLAMFPEEAQDRIWNEDRDALIASSFIFPAGKARPAAGGYLLSGRWAFSSGVGPSAWNMLAGVVDDGGSGPKDHRVFLLHRSQYEILDTWHAAGLKGTGSSDVACTEIFVPEGFTVSADALKGGPTPGASRHPGALYQLPVFGLFPLILSGIALGIAEAAEAGYVGSIRKRASKYSGAKLAEMQSTQIRVGNVGTRIDVARDTMLAICTQAMEDARRGNVPDLATRMRYRRDTAFATRLCVEAVDMIADGTGAQALYLANPLQRQFRDIHAVAAHIAFSMDAASSAYGSVVLGFDTTHPTI